MKAKIIILFVLIGASLIGWSIYAFQRLTTPETTEKEIARAFPKDSYSTFMNANKLTLYSLKKGEAAENFHGYAVLGKTQIDTMSHQLELKSAFIRAMARAKGADCFSPRHGLRAELDGKTVDVVISFECEKFLVYSENEEGGGGVHSRDLESPFNQILKNAGIEITK